MQQRTFNRFEKKYLITDEQKNVILKTIESNLLYDQNIVDKKPYKIYNLYYDTEDYEFIRYSLSKPQYKDKVRLRSYHYPLEDQDLVFLEIKKKFEGRVNKRRIVLTYSEFKKFLTQEIEPEQDDYLNQQVFQEIDYLLKKSTLKPKAYIAYERLALHNEDDSLRVTFDQNIRYRKDDITFDQDQAAPILDDQTLWLMEIKCNQNFPLWLTQLLSQNQIYAQSFSKYGKAYQKFITGETYEHITIPHT